MTSLATGSPQDKELPKDRFSWSTFLTLRLFQEQCGFVSKKTDVSQFISGLTVRQMLYYTSGMTLKVSNTMRRQRLKQVLGDVSLTPVQNVRVQNLNVSERKRLAIALQLIRDPLLLILDDPTANLDALNAYFVVSMLSKCLTTKSTTKTTKIRRSPQVFDHMIL